MPLMRGAITELAEKIKRPRWYVSRRARELGLKTPRFKEPAWSQAEIQLLHDTAHIHTRNAQQRFKREGFNRSETAIHVKRKRMGISAIQARQDAGLYTAGQGGHGAFHREGRQKGARTGAVQSDTRNKRSVWSVATQPFKEAHFATFPPALIEPCILAGCPEGGTVLDAFGGAGTTGLVAARLQRDAVLIELNTEYAAIARRRIHGDAPLFAQIA